jgi:hypothetical protein
MHSIAILALNFFLGSHAPWVREAPSLEFFLGWFGTFFGLIDFPRDVTS